MIVETLVRLAARCLSSDDPPSPGATMGITEGPDGIPAYASAYLTHRMRIAEDLLESLRQGQGKVLGISGVWQHRPTFPLAACFNVHTVCNEACQMCPYPGVWGNKAPELMPFERYQALLDEFASSGGRIVTFNNFSDIFAHRDGIAYVMAAVKRHPALHTYLVTNGMAMRPEYVDALLAEGFEGIVYVSCHGFSQETFLKVTGRRGFEQVLDNTTHLLRHHPHPERIVIQYATDYSSTDEIAAARAYWTDLGARVNDFVTHTFAGNSDHKRTPIGATRLAGCRGWGQDAGQPFYQIVVQADGNVSLCCHDLRARHVLGNAFQDGLAGVWNSPAFRRLVSDLYLGESEDPDFLCRGCGLAQWEERHG